MLVQPVKKVTKETWDLQVKKVIRVTREIWDLLVLLVTLVM